MDRVRRVAAATRRTLSRPASVDWLLAGAFTVAAELEVLIRLPPLSWQQELNAIAALAPLGLAWWRRQPLVPTVLLAGSAVASVAAGARVPMAVPQIALLLAAYSLGAYASSLQMGVGALLPVAMAVAIDRLLPSPPVPLLNGLVWYGIFKTGAPILMGRLVRSRSQLVGRLGQQRTALLVEREAAARQAVTAERQRISRQLRHVVIHNVDSLIAEVALAEADLGEAGHAAVVRIELIARRALGEMRPLLSALHPHDAEKRPTQESLALAPAPEAKFHPVVAPARRLRAALGKTPWPFLLAVLVLVWFEAGIQGLGPSHGPRLLIDAGLIGIAAPIAWSRTRPLAAVAVSVLALVAISRLLIPIPISAGPSPALGFYLPFAVAAFSDRRKALVGLAICTLGPIGAYGFQAPPALVFAVGAWLTGRLLRNHTQLARELESLNRNLAEERDLRAYELVLEERLRVARELHDVIGHTLTVVVLQAGAARRNWVANRRRAARALASLASVAREGLTELVTSLDALEESARATPAGLIFGDVEALIERARSAGMSVAFVPGVLPPIVADPHLELTTYRIVQEALTNVMKHAPRSRAQVRIRFIAGSLDVEVTNSGPLRDRHSDGGPVGQGLLGMAQRVAANGGELKWGPRSSGGFAVRARLPIQELV
jgi:signal transduction histidine kinase